MKRVCRTKRDLWDAQERQDRNDRKRERGNESEEVEYILICKPCGGQLLDEVTLPNGEVAKAIIFEDLEDILSPKHALAYLRRENPSMNMVALTANLKQPDGLNVPYLYEYTRTGRARKPAK